jgi:hypothetical protein
MMLKTLADVRTLMQHLPKRTRDKETWRYVAARGGDTADVAVPLRMVLSMEGVECRPK